MSGAGKRFGGGEGELPTYFAFTRVDCGGRQGVLDLRFSLVN